MKRKNKIKSMVDVCFICGKKFDNLEEKIGHRINPKKGNSKLNLLIVCPKCKKELLKNDCFFLKKEILDKYFTNFSIEDKKIILNKLKSLENYH